MLITIFKYLNPMDRCSLGLCSKQLYQVSNLFLDDIKFHINAKYLAAYDNIGDFLASTRDYCSVLVSGSVVNEEMRKFFERQGTAIELLAFCNAQFEIPIFDILRVLPSLKCLEIYSCDSIGDFKDTFQLEHLEKLVLQFNDNMTRDEFCDLVALAPNLRHFEFLHMQIFDELEAAMIEYLMRQSGKLRVMKILEYYLDDSSLSQLIIEAARFNLQRFYVKESTRLNILEFLRSQKEILEIDLTEYNRLDPVMIKCICDEMSQLQHIKMYNSNLTDDTAGALMRALVNGKLPGLQTLDLSYCRALTSNFVLENLTGQAYGSLKELKIDNLQIDDSAMTLLILTFPNLELLSMAFGFNLTDLSVEAICTLHNLKYLKLTNCNQIQSGIPKIGCLQALRVLHLIEIPNITDEQMLAFSFPNLKELHLVRCNITDAGVDALTMSCRAVEVLDLSMNGEIREISVRMIGERLKRLSKLELRCCKRLDDNIATIINETCKSLKILNVYGTAGRRRQLFDHMLPYCQYLRIIEQ